MHEPRLFKIAPDALTISAAWSHPDGWRLTIWSHVVGDDDAESPAARYTHLTTQELADVIDVEVGVRLLLI